MTLVFKINGTDYGPGGLNLLRTFSPEPCGPGRIGQGTATLLQAGGGADIRTRMEVEAYDWDGSQITAVYFGGFIGRRDTGTLPGSQTTKLWTLNLQDYNLLLKRLVGKAAWAQAIRIPGASFPSFAQQVAHLVSLLQTGASKSIDATSQVVDLQLTGMPDQFFQGRNLDNMLRKLCMDAYVPGVRAAWFIGPDYSVPRATFGDPMLYIYDANSPPVAVMAFSDTPTGGQKSLLLEAGYQRSLDAADQVNWRQGVHQPTGSIYTASDSASIAAYPNPYDAEQAWKEEPLVTTEAVAGPAFQAELEARVADTANPRETLTQSTDAIPAPLPGQYVTDTLSLEGLSTDIYQVATAAIEFPGIGNQVTRSRLELGLPRRLLGEFDTTGNGLPVEGDHVPPDTPGSFALASSTFNWTTGLWDLVFTWAASTAGDLDPVDSYFVRATVNRIRYFAATALLTTTISMAPGAGYSVTVESKDTSNNYSALSSAITGTAAAIPTPATPTWPSGTSWILDNAYDAATNTTRVRVTWDANAGGDHVERYRVVVSDGGGAFRIFLIDKGAVELLLPNETPHTYREFVLTAINIYGVSSSISATVNLLTDQAPPITDNRLPPNGSFEIASSDDATKPAFWAISGTNPGGIVRTQAGGASAGVWACAMTFTAFGGGDTVLTAHHLNSSLLEPGQTYRFSTDYKHLSDPGVNQWILQVFAFDDAGTVTGNGGVNLDHTVTTWGTVSSLFTLPAATTEIQVRLHHIGSTLITTTVYVDNVQVVRLSTSGDLQDGLITTAKLAAGAVTATELAAGAVDQAKLATTLIGTGFPGSPAAGDLFYDTARGRWYGYDGTRWLSVDRWIAAWITRIVFPVSADGIPLIGKLPEARDTWAAEWSTTWAISGTNDSSNYWTVALVVQPANSIIASFDTRTASPHNWTTGALVSADDDNIIQITTTKTGSPGTLTLTTDVMLQEVA